MDTKVLAEFLFSLVVFCLLPLTIFLNYSVTKISDPKASTLRSLNPFNLAKFKYENLKTLDKAISVILFLLGILVCIILIYLSKTHT